MSNPEREEDSRRTRLALVFGGRSGEHDVSVVSARSVAAAFDAERYEIVPMAIDRNGLWADPDAARKALADSGDCTNRVVGFTGSCALDPRLLDGDIDVVFPVLHGPYGEDGTIQGLFEILGVPYVGSDHAASAICMDKSTTKRLLSQEGLPTPDWVTIDGSAWTRDPGGRRAECLALGLPIFVKPARLGSSVGISKVNEPEHLDAAVERALSHDRKVVVERGIDAREIEVAVLGNSEPRAAVPGEVIPGHEFYDYEDKYLDDSCRLLAPAPLDHHVSRNVAKLALSAYRTLGCEGMARVDLFLERPTDTLWINEINTIPGFTAISMFPRLWGLTGLSYPELLDELVRLAFERHSRQ